MDNEKIKSFYQKCSDILETDFVWIEPPHKQTRWTRKTPGNGRFSGYGVIRYYNNNTIHIMFKKFNKLFNSEEEAINAIKKLINY